VEFLAYILSVIVALGLSFQYSYFSFSVCSPLHVKIHPNTINQPQPMRLYYFINP